jgi:hypothetical protein
VEEEEEEEIVFVAKPAKPKKHFSSPILMSTPALHSPVAHSAMPPLHARMGALQLHNNNPPPPVPKQEKKKKQAGGLMPSQLY